MLSKIHLGKISLKTYDPVNSREIGGILHSESEWVFELMSSASLSQSEARAWLEQVVREELARINRLRLVELDDRKPDAFEGFVANFV